MILPTACFSFVRSSLGSSRDIRLRQVIGPSFSCWKTFLLRDQVHSACLSVVLLIVSHVRRIERARKSDPLKVSYGWCHALVKWQGRQGVSGNAFDGVPSVAFRKMRDIGREGEDDLQAVKEKKHLIQPTDPEREDRCSRFLM